MKTRVSVDSNREVTVVTQLDRNNLRSRRTNGNRLYHKREPFTTLTESKVYRALSKRVYSKEEARSVD